MSYKSLVSITVAGKNELFCRLRDFICKRNGTYDYSTEGIGWTLHDYSYATDEDNCTINDWFVIYSPGENGKEDIYIKVLWTSAYISFYGYQSWNASTHAGSTNNYNPSSSSWSIAETGSLVMWVYGDLNFITVLNRLSYTDYRVSFFGKLSSCFSDVSDSVANCTTSLTAGSDVSIVVDSAPVSWEAGRELYIRTTHNNDMSTVKIEKTTIKTIDSNTITADLTYSYPTSAALSEIVGYTTQAIYQFYSTCYTLIDANKTNNASITLLAVLLSSTSVDPDTYENAVISSDIVCSTNYGVIGKLPYIKYSPNLSVNYAAEDSFTDADSVSWKFFVAYSGKYIVVREA